MTGLEELSVLGWTLCVVREVVFGDRELSYEARGEGISSSNAKDDQN